MIGRNTLNEEQASPNYRLREVRRRRTGEVSWEIVDDDSGHTILAGFDHRNEALRVIRSLERLSQNRQDGLPGHVIVH